MITKFKTTGVEYPIQEVEVLRETTASVYVPGYRGAERREAKETNWGTYHDTWEAAHAHLMSKAESDVQIARRRLERANGTLGNIKGMRPLKDVK